MKICKSIVLIALLSFGVVTLATVDSSDKKILYLCDNLIGDWYGSGDLDKTVDCKYDVDASVSWSNPGYMRLKMRSVSDNPLCRRYYSERVRLSCNGIYVNATSPSLKVGGYTNYLSDDVVLTGSLLSRLHYHPFSLKLHRK